MENVQAGFVKVGYKEFATKISAVRETGGELLYLFNSGNAAAFTEVYQRLYPAVIFFARRFVNHEEAEDITADIFCKLWKKEKHFTDMQAIKIFLQISVRNACLNHFEHQQVVNRQRKACMMAFDEKSDGFFYEDEIKAEYIKLIHREIEKLPSQCGKICKMAWLNGQKNHEIAAELQLSEKTVRNQKVKGLKLLRMAIAPLHGQIFCLLVIEAFCTI